MPDRLVGLKRCSLLGGGGSRMTIWRNWAQHMSSAQVCFHKDDPGQHPRANSLLPPSFKAIIKSEPFEGDRSRQPTLGSSGHLRGSKMELTKKTCPFVHFHLLGAKDMSAAWDGHCCWTLQQGLIFKQEILTSPICSPVTKALLTQRRCVIYVTSIMRL